MQRVVGHIKRKRFRCWHCIALIFCGSLIILKNWLGDDFCKNAKQISGGACRNSLKIFHDRYLSMGGVSILNLI